MVELGIMSSQEEVLWKKMHNFYRDTCGSRVQLMYMLLYSYHVVI